MWNLIRTVSWYNKKSEARLTNAFCDSEFFRLIVRYMDLFYNFYTNYKVFNFDNLYNDECASREKEAQTKYIFQQTPIVQQ